MQHLSVEPHPLLDAQACLCEFAQPLAELETPETILELLAGGDSPVTMPEDTAGRIRAMLRHGGFKPSGRSKPASEYLRGAAERGTLQPINLAVDLGNVVSLHTGVPISVIDLDCAAEPYRVAVAGPGAEYVFNQSGQTIDLGGLLCLFDKEGPCANAVKDSQRTKTSSTTNRTLILFWSSRELSGWGAEALSWFCRLAAAAPVTVTQLELTA